MKTHITCGALLILVLLGCAITTTYGVKPKRSPLHPDVYSFTVFYNAYTTRYDCDKKAEQLIAAFLEERDYSYYRLLNVVDNSMTWRIVYEVEFSHSAFPSDYDDPLIIADKREGPPLKKQLTSQGTGFVVAHGGYVLTCAHVVELASRIQLVSSGGTTHDASIVLFDKDSDWCLLQSSTLNKKPINISQEATLRVGMTVFNLSYPLSGILQNINPVANKGNLSALQGLQGDPKHLQTSIPVNPGSSGSPLINEYGNWIGLVSHRLNDLYALQHTGSLPQGTNFAIKASFVADLIRSSSSISLNTGHTDKPLRLEDIVDIYSNSIVRVIGMPE